MFQLHELRESKVWQEAQQLKAQEFIRRLQSKGKSLKEIAELLDIPLNEVRRLARRDT